MVKSNFDEMCGDESEKLIRFELVSDGKRGIVDKRLEHAHVGEALLVLSHVYEKEQVLKLDAKKESPSLRVRVVRLVARKSRQLVQLVEQRLVAACVFFREWPTRPGVGGVRWQELESSLGARHARERIGESVRVARQTCCCACRRGSKCANDRTASSCASRAK